MALLCRFFFYLLSIAVFSENTSGKGKASPSITAFFHIWAVVCTVTSTYDTSSSYQSGLGGERKRS